MTFGFVDSGQLLMGTNPDGGVSHEVKLADLDRDGDLDAINSNRSSAGVNSGGAGTQIFLNDGRGNYSTGQLIETASDTINIEVGDVNGDGHLDVVLGNFRSASPVSVWINNGNATFTFGQTITGGPGVGMGDVDGDGDLDIASGGGSLSIWKNNGSGVFTKTSIVPGINAVAEEIEMADLDRDGDLDVAAVAVLDSSNPAADWHTRVFLNNGSGSFTATSQIITPRLFARDLNLADVTGDGKIDLLVAMPDSGSDGVRVFVNNGSASFSQLGAQFNGSTRRVETADLDGDGDLDLVASKGNAQPIFLNDGTGGFTRFNNPVAIGAGLSYAIGDVDGDRDLDLFQGNGVFNTGFGQKDKVWLNGVGVSNQPPTLASNNAGVSASEGGTVTNTGTFSDAQGNNTVTISASVGAVIKNDATETWSWSLNVADGPAGPTSVTITATDNGGAAANTTFTYAVNNVPPTISLSGNVTVNEGSPYTLNLGPISDPGADTISSYTINWGDGTTQTLSGSPANTVKTHTYADGPATLTSNITVTDEDGTFLGGTLSVQVLNVNPNAVDDAFSATEDGIAQALDLLGNDSDPAGANDPLAITGVNTLSTIGQVMLASGQVSYNPNGQFESLGAGETAIDAFSYSISDGDGGSGTATVTMTITGQNDAPTAVGSIANVVVNQNAANTVISLAGLFHDVDANDTLTITAVSSVSGLVTTSISGNSLALDYQANQSGTATITVTGTDSSGAAVSLNFTVTVRSPQEQADGIKALILQWKTDGKINSGIANSMIVKVDNALKSYDKGNLNAAEGQLGALKNEISAKVKPGGLTNADATLAISLIDALYDSMTP